MTDPDIPHAARTAIIMLRMGFPAMPTDDGPMVAELRRVIHAKVERGLVNASAGTWSKPIAELTAEERARAFLTTEWEVEQGNFTKVRCIDGPPWRRRYDLRTGRSSMEVKLDQFPDYLRDRRDRALLSLRLFWTRGVLRRRNPYIERKPIVWKWRLP